MEYFCRRPSNIPYSSLYCIDFTSIAKLLEGSLLKDYHCCPNFTIVTGRNKSEILIHILWRLFFQSVIHGLVTSNLFFWCIICISRPWVLWCVRRKTSRKHWLSFWPKWVPIYTDHLLEMQYTGNNSIHSIKCGPKMNPDLVLNS